MNFDNLNNLIKSSPEIYHFLVSGILIAMMAHLIIGFVHMYIKKPRLFNIIWIVSYSVVLFLFFGKFSSPGYTMLDIFLPVYFIFYIQSVMFFNMRFRFCKCTIRDVVKFGYR